MKLPITISYENHIACIGVKDQNKIITIASLSIEELIDFRDRINVVIHNMTINDEYYDEIR